MKAPPTLKDVARAVGLSAGAVSLALRNSPKIAVTTRARVREAARRLGYRPNPAGATLAQFRHASTVKPIQASLAWLNTWDRPADLRSFRQFDRYWQGAEASAASFGYRLEEFVYRDLMPQARLMHILAARGIQGLLLPPGPVPPEWTRGTPVWSISRSFGSGDRARSCPFTASRRARWRTRCWPLRRPGKKAVSGSAWSRSPGVPGFSPRDICGRSNWRSRRPRVCRLFYFRIPLRKRSNRG